MKLKKKIFCSMNLVTHCDVIRYCCVRKGSTANVIKTSL